VYLCARECMCVCHYYDNNLIHFGLANRAAEDNKVFLVTQSPQAT